MNRGILTLISALTTMSLSLGYAQTLYRLPDALSQLAGDTVQVRAGGRVSNYVEGIGWVPDGPDSVPVVVGGAVYVEADALDYFGLTSARLDAVRSSSADGVRLVFDISNLDASVLESLAQEGRLEPDTPLSLTLPPLLLPLEYPASFEGIDLDLRATPSGTLLTLSGVGARYTLFSLTGPTRLVIDLEPLQFARITPETREVASGVRYRRFAAATETGSSGVHLIEIAAGMGDFRVVGESFVPRTLSQLASGGLVAINAGYFDTSNFRSIGLLRVDSTLLSLPYLRRASIGFGLSGPLIERVEADVRVNLNGQTYYAEGLNRAGRIAVYPGPSRAAGDPSRGVIVVEDGRVTENRIGPRHVSETGFAIVYEPDIRALALVDPGVPARLEATLLPTSFETLPYAVEAGPLLVYEGQAAYDPSQEAINPDAEIVGRRTQQAAIGVRADGTVLLVTADAMTASELVPLFLSLGATRAMRLDSGSSTTLYAAGEVLNRAFQRPIVSAIVFIPN